MVLGFLRGLLSGGGANGGAPPAGPPVEYKGYSITATPRKDDAGWRVMGVISREIDGELRSHTFIRADTSPDRDAAAEMTVRKAKRLVDEQGDAIF